MVCATAGKSRYTFFASCAKPVLPEPSALRTVEPQLAETESAVTVALNYLAASAGEDTVQTALVSPANALPEVIVNVID